MENFQKLKSIFKKLSIEEWFLIFASLLLSLIIAFLVIFKTRDYGDFFALFKLGGVCLGSKGTLWIAELLSLFFLYFFYQILQFVALQRKDIPLRKFLISVKKEISGLFPAIRIVVILSIFTSVSLTLLGLIYSLVQGRLKNEWILNLEHHIFGAYPFLWLHSSFNPLRGLFSFLSSAMILSFSSLGFVMVFTGLFFYFISKKKRIFRAYIISFAIVMLLSFPFWYFFPVNSPNNAYLAGSNLPAYYQPEKKVVQFEEAFRKEQEKDPPISTFPSMHVAWALIAVYYLAKFSKKTLFLSLPWAVLLIASTVYLAQHYLVDAFLSMFLVAATIPLANFLSKKGDYYKPPQSSVFLTERIKADFKKIKEMLAGVEETVRKALLPK